MHYALSFFYAFTGHCQCALGSTLGSSNLSFFDKNKPPSIVLGIVGCHQVFLQSTLYLAAADGRPKLGMLTELDGDGKLPVRASLHSSELFSASEHLGSTCRLPYVRGQTESKRNQPDVLVLIMRITKLRKETCNTRLLSNQCVMHTPTRTAM